MVHAMFIVFLLFLDIYSTYCQITTTTAPPNPVYGCSFLNTKYLTSAAVSDQFEFPNRTSIILTAGYSFLSAPLSISTFEVGLVYPFSTSNKLVPFPFLLNCAYSVRSCQLKTIAVAQYTSRDSEAIRVQLTSFNYKSSSISFNQMGLYLREGRYQLSNCLLNDEHSITEPNTTFIIEIKYEKVVGASCIPSVDTCGSPSLTTCSTSSSTCVCLSTSSLVTYSTSSYCADTQNASNCNIFPTRCVTWCNSTTNSLCICPIDTLRIQRNNSYVCELPVDSLNCSSNDTIRRCQLGQTCINGQCTDLIISTTIAYITDNSSDRNLRIALGVIAGLLGTSLIILIVILCWLRIRKKRLHAKNTKTSTPTLSSSTSSLYISPIQQESPASSNPIYQLPVDTSYKKVPSIYRTDSFRQAILLGHNRTKPTMEHISAKRDSFVGRSLYPKDDFGSPIYSTLDYVVPTQTKSYYQDSNQLNNDFYHVINTSSSTTLTHAV